MLHIVESRKPLDRVAKDLEEAVARHHFGVLGVHDLKAAMAKKGVDFGPECRIFEVCKLATIKPTTLIDLYSTPGLKDVAREVEATLEAIMAEAAR
jgi:uncharacterized protein (DUF302 family)